MPLLQVLDLIESTLQANNVTAIRSLPNAHYAVKALTTSGFEIRNVMQIWQNVEQINDTMGDMEVIRGETESIRQVLCDLADCSFNIDGLDPTPSL